MYVCMLVCMLVCMDGWMDGWVCVCTRMRVRMLIHINLSLYEHTNYPINALYIGGVDGLVNGHCRLA